MLKNRLDGIKDLLEDLGPDVPLYVANQNVMDAIAGFHMHRGILALGQFEPELQLSQVYDKDLVLILSAISNHDNMGAIFRRNSANRCSTSGSEEVL